MIVFESGTTPEEAENLSYQTRRFDVSVEFARSLGAPFLVRRRSEFGTMVLDGFFSTLERARRYVEVVGGACNVEDLTGVEIST